MKIGMVAGSLLCAVVCLPFPGGPSRSAQGSMPPRRRRSSAKKNTCSATSFIRAIRSAGPWSIAAGSARRFPPARRRPRRQPPRSRSGGCMKCSRTVQWFRPFGGERRHAAPPQRSRRGPLRQPHRSLRSPRFRRRGPCDRRAVGPGDDRRPGQAPASGSRIVKAAVAGQGEITIQLPEQAVAVGSRWSSPSNIDVPLATAACGGSAPCRVSSWRT